jgi:hypothetical protein
MAVCVLRYICLGGSSVPSPTDGTHGYKCPPGFYCPSGAHHELPCKPGTFSPLSGADTCLPCPQGTYCPQAATVEPITCPKGNPRLALTSFSSVEQLDAQGPDSVMLLIFRASIPNVQIDLRSIDQTHPSNGAGCTVEGRCGVKVMSLDKYSLSLPL